MLPAELRQQGNVQPGQVFEIGRVDLDDRRLVRRTALPIHGVVDWLLGCPEKTYLPKIVAASQVPAIFFRATSNNMRP